MMFLRDIHFLPLDGIGQHGEVASCVVLVVKNQAAKECGGCCSKTLMS
jgi:hypothetical protein